MSPETANDRYQPKRYSKNFSDTITVLVGPEGEEENFTIHKDLICSASKFFKAACSKLWAEGQEKVVRLPEVKVGTFQAYVVWVYHGQVAVNKGNASQEFREAIELFLLGDLLDDLPLRNAAMRTLVTRNKDWKIQPRADVFNYVWDSTTAGSRLRQMLVDTTIMRWGRDYISDDILAGYPKNMLCVIARTLLKQSNTASHDAFASRLNKYLEPETSGNDLDQEA